jgi:hypothetical protein
MENTILINELLKEKEILLERIEAVNRFLLAYGYKDDKKKSVTPAALEENFNPLTGYQYVRKDFPIDGRKDNQVLWLFNNHFDKGIKLNELQSKYNELKGFDDKGDEIRIDNTARRLKRESKLVVVKYNNSNKNAFWGLPEWIENNDFKEEYRPDKNKLPIDIESTDVSIGN